MKKLLALLAILLCCPLVQAQNIEGQIVASQFGQYQVPGIATGSLQFQPASCQVSGGGKNFAAFSTGVPVKIVDANPALTEIDTPSSVNITGCSISMATTYIHSTPFYATSGTGGLQEALLNGPAKQGGPNTVILNADWYAQVAPGNPAGVIAAVQGSTSLGLVDVTTVPYTVYAWNGAKYAIVPYGSGGGSNFPTTPGIVWNLTTSTSRNATSNDLVTLLGASNLNANAAGLWGTPALPNGTQATTGTVGQNDNLLATNAQVFASRNASIPANGGVLVTGGTAGLAVATLALPNSTTATTQATGPCDTTGKVATDAFVAACGGSSTVTTYTVGTGGVTAGSLVMGDGSGKVITYVSSSVNYGLYTGIATATVATNGTVTVANSGGQLQACQFDGTPVVGDAVIGSVSVDGECHDNGFPNLYIVGALIPVVGWVQSISGTVGTVRLAGLGVWGSGNVVVDNSLNTQTFFGPLVAWDSITPAKLGRIFDADGFTVGNNYPGVGVAQIPWVAGGYGHCNAVSYLGNNYILTVYRSSNTPGADSTVWYPVPNGNTPTGLDCAFYTAAASIVSGTGTVATGAPASLIMGSGSYTTNIGLMEPTVSTPGNPVVNLLGQGKGNTTIFQGTAITNPTLEQPPSLTGFAFASFVWNGFTINSNFLAPAVMGTYGAQQFTQSDLIAENAIDGSDHYIEWGLFGDTAHGWTYEADIERIIIDRTVGFGGGAIVTTTVSGGVPSFTIVNGGSGYKTADLQVILGGTSNFGRPCSSMGTTTGTLTSGVLTGVTSTATGCIDPVYTIVYGGANINYGFKFSNMSDRGKIDGLTNGAVGWISGMYLSNITNALTINNYHPIGTLRGVQNFGGATFNSLQCDTIFQYCFDNEAGGGTVNLNNPFYEWNNNNMTGSRDLFFNAVSGVPGFSEPAAFNITGEVCGNKAQQLGYAHFDTSAGVVDSSVGSDVGSIPVYVTDNAPVYCNHATDVPNTPVADMVGQTISWGNGVVGNLWNFNIGGGFITGGGQTLNLTQVNSTATASIGTYTWNFQNPTASTSGQNYTSPTTGHFGTYWNSSASVPLGVTQQLTFASGSNPLANYATAHSGTLPTGGLVYSWDSTIQVPAERSGTSSNTDLVGVLALSGGTKSYTFLKPYATPPVCTTQDRTTPSNTSNAATTTTVLTLNGTGTDSIGWICMGLN